MAVSSLKLILASGSALAALAGAMPALAQDTATTAAQLPPTQDESAAEDDGKGIIVTGSRIRQDPNRSALPLQIITTQELSREGISSPEQLVMFLSTNGSGPDNLASNGDVVAGAARGGNNGLSSANLRGQGAGATLVLLNGRRVAAHGIGGGSVDVNQIPFAAIERIEILKDGASAIYGTDAVGGVMNFITKNNFQGISLSGFTDITQEGDAPIYRISGTAGYGDLDEQGFNIMAAVSKSWNGVLYGRDRDFVNVYQPNRGLSVDTRGTPIATAFAINPTAAGIGITQGGTLLGSANATGNPYFLSGLVLPGTTTFAGSGGINPLNLPGGAGCDSYDGGMPYDYQLWNIPGARYACGYDTGRAAVLQQPIETLTYYGRGTARIGSHELYAEVTGSKATSHKRFSENQYTASNTAMPIAFPLNSLTATTYNDVYDRIAAVFPAIGAVGDRTVDAVGNYGKPITFRYRCMDCGLREYTTNTKTFRAAIGAEGPLFGDFDYRTGASYSRSEASSVLGTGYHYRGVFASNATAVASGTGATLAGQADPRAPTAPGATAPGIVGLFNSGILNPFSLTQSAQALAGLEAISAKGVTLYGGRYEVKQADASISGPLFGLPGGQVQMAVGVDYRKETYSFNGSAAAAANQPDIFNVAFDNANALTPKNRDVKAAYAELLVPIFPWFEVSGAVRVDDYSGFGTTTNPKVTAKFRPFDWIMFRGSYNTGFRVPAFNQIFNGVTQSPNPGNARADPTTCPAGGVINVTPGCAAITPDSLTGGNLNLGPETSKQWSTGVVFQPISNFTASVDYWNIAVDNTIGSLTIDQLLNNQSFFPDRVTRTGGVITLLDVRADNIGSRRTEGLEVTVRGNIEAFGGRFVAGLDGTRLLKKREKFLPSSPYGPSLIGVFTFGGDLGVEWKHNAFISWANDDISFSLSNIFRKGYRNYQIGVVGGARPDYNRYVKDYSIYNAAISYTGLGPNYKLTLGVRNLFNTDPPFAITYNTDTGAGSSWEPRVADPRGRSFTVAVETKF
ncbi:TonB-dependent receptor domain-containing protein [Sphingomonas soli]|uniref:TonB-dependent receptor domain-containing protein n=1 Tax=Sphingomonas soli TaxID=266127 RepID=UPI000829E973|nr:TonB-dependent receptor [Sphingomonas soli]